MSEISMREKAGLLAYSPLAVGYLTGKYRNKEIPKNSRLDLFYENYPRYHNERTYEAVDEYFKISQKYKISLAKLALAFSIYFTTKKCNTMEQEKCYENNIADTKNGIAFFHNSLRAIQFRS